MNVKDKKRNATEKCEEEKNDIVLMYEVINGDPQIDSIVLCINDFLKQSLILASSVT